MKNSVLSASNVRKHYGGVEALAGVDLQVHPGEVHALVGVNGAGKSTLMKILAGAEPQDSGELLYGGEPVQYKNVREAAAAGVSIVFQELSLYGDLDVLANLFLLKEPRTWGIVRRKLMERTARDALDSVGLDVDLRRRVGDLKLGEQQLVEIAKAILDRSSVLILDEPNSALNAFESERLFTIVRRLRDEGTAVVYVSHRLEEVFAISDRVSVLRNGQIVERSRIANTTIPQVVASMLGHQPSEDKPKVRRMALGGDPSLLVEGLSIHADDVANVSFSVKPGEIVGLAGLEGAGPRSVFDVLAGLRKADAGGAVLPDGGAAPSSAHEAVGRGVAHVPADRRTSGAALDQSNSENLLQVTVGALGRGGFWLRAKQLLDEVRLLMEKLRIGGTPQLPTRSLSGGNQQKVVLGKWLAAEPSVFLCDDPTRGVDVGAKSEIYGLLREAADRGCAILFSSSEVQEYLAVCDRVIVFFAGRVATEFTSEELSVHGLLEAINTGRKAELEDQK